MIPRINIYQIRNSIDNEQKRLRITCLKSV
jgi:hypothetical protein